MGISAFLNGIGHLLGKIPLQGRIERLKNELEALQTERNALLHGEANEKKSARLCVIDKRLDVIRGVLKNSAQDN
jgi:hypothetical protein